MKIWYLKFILLILPLPLCLQAQNPKIKYGITLKPGLSFMHYTSQDFRAPATNDLMKPAFSFAAGGFIDYGLNQRFALSAGVEYQLLRAKTDDINYFSNSYYDTVVNQFIDKGTYKHNFHYITIPVLLKIKPVGQPLEISAGIMPGIYLGNTDKNILESSNGESHSYINKGKYDEFRALQWNGVICLNYQAHTRLNIGVFAYIPFQGVLTDSGAGDFKLWNTGINFSIILDHEK